MRVFKQELWFANIQLYDRTKKGVGFDKMTLLWSQFGMTVYEGCLIYLKCKYLDKMKF